eukprot:scaffold10.g2411.t1
MELLNTTLRREIGSPQAAGRRAALAGGGPFPIGGAQPAFTPGEARKLTVETVLRGHSGCVNRLHWNEAGTMLASASDDRTVMLWHYPDTQLAPLMVQTSHQANIFGVRWLPATNDTQLVTGAMDYTVQLHTLRTPPTAMRSSARKNAAAPMRRHPEAGAVRVPCHTTLYACHRGRVKASPRAERGRSVQGVEVEPGCPHLFWSASEDGVLRQFDVRLPSAQQADYDSPNALVAVCSRGGRGPPLELKGLALNAVRPHELAVAAGDQYVRIYDRRMLSPASPEPWRRGGPGRTGGLGVPLLSLAPPHMCWGEGAGGRRRGIHTTYVAFGHRGDKASAPSQVVASYHADHAYTFDITHSAADASLKAVRMGGAAPGGGTARTGAGAAPASPRAAGTGAYAELLASGSLHQGAGGGDGVSPSTSAEGLAEQLRQAQGAAQPSPDLFGHPPPTWAPSAIFRPPSAGAGASGIAAATAAGPSEAAAPVGAAVAAVLLPPEAERAKADGNLYLFNKQAQQAVEAYSEALRAAPWAGLLYTNRCLALLQRGWEGDATAALADAEVAAALDPRNPKAYFRRARQPERLRAQALRACKLLRSAAAAAELYRARFPAQAGDVEELEEGIADALAEQARQAEAAAQQRQARQAEAAVQQRQARRATRRRRGFSRERPHRVSEGGGGSGGAAGEGAGATAAAAAEAAEAAEEGRAGGPASAGAAPGSPRGDEGAASAAETHMELHFSDSGAEDDAAEEPWRDEDGVEGGGGRRRDAGASSSSGASGGGEGGGGGGASRVAPLGADEQYAAALREAAAAEVAAAEGGNGGAGGAPPQLPSLWGALEGGRRMLHRYVGHCNVQTDIKEAVFLGAGDELVAAGSDDGRVCIYDAATGEAVRVLEADEEVANCIAPHPCLPVLATSGIEHTIKVWSPQGPPTPGGDLRELVARNQERMREGPTVIRGIDPRILAALTDNPQLLHALVAQATRGAGRGGEGEGGSGEEGEEEDEEDEEGAGGLVREVTPVAMEIVISALVAQLGSSDEAAQAATVDQLRNLSRGSCSNADVVAAAGGIPLLVCQLDAATEDARLTAAAALATVFQTSGSSREVGASAIPPLVRLLSTASKPFTQASAAVALAHLTRHKPNMSAILSAAEAAITPLVDLLGGAYSPGQTAASWLLHDFASARNSSIPAIAAAGAIPPLVSLLDAPVAVTQQFAAAALASLASYKPNQDALAAAGAIPAAVRLLDATCVHTQSGPAQLLSSLGHHEHSKAAIAAAGAIPRLLRMLCGCAEAGQEAATTALDVLADGQPAIQAAIIAAGGIPLLQQLAQQSSRDRVRQDSAALVDVLEKVAAEQRAEAAAAELLAEEERRAAQQAAKASTKAARRQRHKARRRAAVAAAGQHDEEPHTEAAEVADDAGSPAALPAQERGELEVHTPAPPQAGIAVPAHEMLSASGTGSSGRHKKKQGGRGATATRAAPTAVDKAGSSSTPSAGQHVARAVDAEVLESGPAAAPADGEADSELAQLTQEMGVSQATAADVCGSAGPGTAAVASPPAGEALPVPSSAAGPAQQPQQPGGDEGAPAASAGGGRAGFIGAALFELVCPIAQEPMRDPVVVADRRTYERAAIEAWIARQQAEGLAPTSPMTAQPLEHLQLTPNHALRILAASAVAAGLLR